ncbi:Ig-like domain-containing protein [Streptomyces sp. DB-54]
MVQTQSTAHRRNGHGESGRRISAAVACAAVVGSVVFVGAPAAQAATPTVLTMNGSTVTGAAYAGTQAQSFNLVKQGDGSWGIRNTYSGKVLNMNGSTVTGQTYNGTQPQSFNLVKQGDGSWGIRNTYSGKVLNMNGSTVTGQTYNGTQPQSWQLVKQGDGSWGIRAFYGGDRLPQEPKAENDAAVAEPGRETTVNVLANDRGTGTTTSAGLRVTAVAKPEHGTAELRDGKVVYSPDPGHTGCDSFAYTVTDELGQRSTATVHMATGAVNDSSPGAISGTAVAVDGSSVGTAPYQDGAGAQSFTLVRQGDGSWGLRHRGTEGVLTVRGPGQVSVEPYAGNANQSFDLVAQGDGSTGIRNTYSGLALTVAGSSVTARPFNGTQPQSLQLVDRGDGTYAILTYYGSTRVAQNPVARDDAAQARPGAPVTIDVLANDTDGGSTTAGGLTVSGVDAPANGTATVRDGKVVYTPSSGFSGCDAFTYTVTDRRGQTSTATVSVVTPAK